MGSNHAEGAGRMTTTTRERVNNLEEVLPESLVGCIRMCLSNVVAADFFIATFGRTKLEILKWGDASLSETASQVAVDALFAQAFKDADLNELELMQIAAMDMIVDLDASIPIESGDTLLSSIEDVTPSVLSERRESAAVATKVADAVSAIYWDPVIKLVDVLIEVVGKKMDAEYRSALADWNVRCEEKKNVLDVALEAEKKAGRDRAAAADDLSDLERQLYRVSKGNNGHDSLQALYDEAVYARERIMPLEDDLRTVLRNQAGTKKTLSELESELSNLGAFAFGKKKAVKSEIKSLEDKLKNLEASARDLGDQIELRKKKVARIPELEAKLSELADLNEKIRLAEVRDNHFRERYEEAKEVRRKAQVDLNACKSDKPKTCDYSAESAKRSLRWRPKAPVFKATSPIGAGQAFAKSQDTKASKSSSFANTSKPSSAYSGSYGSIGTKARESANSAVDLVKKMCDVDLEYGPTGIAQIEMVLGLVYDQRAGLGWDDDTLWGLANMTGCFLGECMLLSGFRELGFQWGEDPDGEPVLANKTNKEGFSLGAIRPVTKCFKRMLNGPEDGIVHYYSTCMAMARI